MIDPRRLAHLAAVTVMIASAHEAAADRIQVKVIEIAGGLAYVTPGADAGLRPGMTISFGRRKLVIVEVTARTAVVQLESATLAVGDRGAADGVEPGAATVERLPPPRPASTWTGQWPAPVMPSSQQSPAAVPLGQGRAPGQLHVAVIGTAIFTPSARRTSDGEDEGSSLGGDGEARARLILSYDLWQDGRIAADLDATARLYTTGSSRSRTPVWIRAAQLRYGTARDPRLALGRLPWAATGVGVLDGMRASARLGGFELAAFGGLVPDQLDGRPDPGATRFGAEVIYDAVDTAWQPRIGLTAYGSTWDGELDERRASVHAGVTRGGLDVDGWAEVQSFAAGNPWGANAVELVGAGVGVEYRRRGRHAGVDVTVLRPERSLRLAAALPPEWLCSGIPGSGDPEVCEDGELWTWATASAGVSISRLFIDVGGSIGTTHASARVVDASAFGRAELRGLPLRGRLIGGGSYGRSSFVDWAGGELGVGLAPVEKVDVAVTYRPELLAYRARTEVWLQHSVALDLRWSLRTELDIGAAAIASTGPDRDSITLIGTVAWRPLP
jgi:hypothetical protein